MLISQRKLTPALTVIIVAASFCLSPRMVSGGSWFQGSAATPLQLAIEKQAERLRSPDIEERRDALMRLAAIHRAEAARVAIPALSDSEPIVRATAAGAVRSLPGDEAARALLPLLNDRDEFVRREGVYALGHSRSRIAVAPLIERLNTDKQVQVRAAAVVALGEIGDEAAVVPLVEVLSPAQSGAKQQKRRPSKENEFVLRATAHSLGQIRSRSGGPALIRVVSDDSYPPDVRREAANSLGLIGDPAALESLRTAATSADPYLSRTAHRALQRLSANQAVNQ